MLRKKIRLLGTGRHPVKAIAIESMLRGQKTSCRGQHRLSENGVGINAIASIIDGTSLLRQSCANGPGFDTRKGSRHRQRVRDDEQAAYVYWQKQVEAGVMLDSQKNRDAAIAYLSEHNQLPSVATIQAALMELHETLEKPEVLGTLPNGEKQLPIDASESEMKRASVQQLRDLSVRRFEGKSRPAGSFGGRF